MCKDWSPAHSQDCFETPDSDAMGTGALESLNGLTCFRRWPILHSPKGAQACCHSVATDEVSCSAPHSDFDVCQPPKAQEQAAGGIYNIRMTLHKLMYVETGAMLSSQVCLKIPRSYAIKTTALRSVGSLT